MFLEARTCRSLGRVVTRLLLYIFGLPLCPLGYVGNGLPQIAHRLLNRENCHPQLASMKISMT